jgi:hypothetical protein
MDGTHNLDRVRMSLEEKTHTKSAGQIKKSKRIAGAEKIKKGARPK